MSKNWFIQILSLFACGILSATFILNKVFHERYFPHTIDLNLQTSLLVLIFSILLISFVCSVVKYEKHFIPGILARLKELKNLLFELNQFEIFYVSLMAGF
jgi:hypothetical protein